MWRYANPLGFHRQSGFDALADIGDEGGFAP
jgi:hypothetical protein